jgi:hypothetical protein
VGRDSTVSVHVLHEFKRNFKLGAGRGVGQGGRLTNHLGTKGERGHVNTGPEIEIGKAEAEEKSRSLYRPIMLNRVQCVGITMTSHIQMLPPNEWQYSKIPA